MRKHLAILCAALLCACCLILAACGGSSSSAASASSSASASSASASASSSSEAASASSESASASSEAASSSAASPADNFVGTWKVAAVIFQGVTMVGDFEAVYGDEVNMSFTINADGTGSASMNGETKNLTWEQKGDDVISMKVEGGGELEEAKYENGTLQLKMPSSDFDGTAILSKDGKVEGISEIDTSAATPITSQDALVGDWSLTGACMMGMSMYGDKDALINAFGGASDSSSLTFNADGTAKVMGEDATWTVGADGATISLSGIPLAVKALGDDIIIDMSSIIGSQGAMLYSK